MRAALFACLLVVAGVSAMPPQDIAPAQDRFLDLWVTDAIGRFIDYIVAVGYDPLQKEYYVFETTLISDLVFVKGFVKELNVVGLSGIFINNVNYNILLGRLDLDLALGEVKLNVGQYVAEGRYGGRGGVGELAGSLVITNLQVVLDTLLTVIPGAPVTIHNINTRVTLGAIKAEFDASWKCLGCETERDVSSCVNNVLNYRVPEWLVYYEAEIGTLLGEAIRRTVNRWW